MSKVTSPIVLLLMAFIGVPPAVAQTAPDNQAQMQQMREKLNEMQALMDRTRSARNARERSRLLDEHMNAMTEAMVLTERMTREMEQRAEAVTPQCAAGDAACRMDRMQARQGVMNERMDMMQMMMRHMMGRMQEQAPAPAAPPEAEGESETGAEDHTEHH